MFLHATSVAEEKHVIHLLLVLALQFLILSSKPRLEFLHLLPQLLVFLFDFLTLSLRCFLISLN